MADGTTLPGWGRAQAAVGVALFLCLFAAQAGLIVLTPVLSEVADDLDVSTAAAGQLRTVSGLTAGLTAILLGTVGRSLSLRRVLIGGAMGLALASVVSAAAPSFVVLALGQGLLGISVAALLVGGTVAAAEWVPREHRTRVLAWALVGPPAAWIVGMPLIGAIGEIDWRWTWLALPLAAALVAGLAIALRSESPRSAGTESMTTALRDPSTARWVLGELLASSAWIGTLVFSGALFSESYNASTILTGIVLSAGAVAYVGGNVFFRRVVSCGAHVLLVRLSLVLALGVALFGTVRPALPVSLGLFAATAFVAGGRTLIGSAVGLEAAPERRLAVMSARSAGQQLGYFFGAAAAGGALAAGGYPGFGLALGLIFLVSAVPFLVDARRRAGTYRAVLVQPACDADVVTPVGAYLRNALGALAAGRPAPDSKVADLLRVPLFAALPRDRFELLMRTADIIDVPAEKELIREGDHGREFFAIAQGAVEISKGGKPIATESAGDVFGELALLHGIPRTATAKTTSPSRLIVLTAQAFRSVLAPSVTWKAGWVAR